MRSAHLVELGLPLGAQFLVLEDDADDLGAMIGRSGEMVPRMMFCSCAGDDIGLGGVPGDGDGDADALAVEAEILAAPRRRPCDFGHRGDDLAGAIGVFLEAIAEAEIGEVDEREGAGAREARGHLVPLRVA